MNWALNTDSPCLAEQSHDGRWGYTVCASASGSYPETQHHVGEVRRHSKQNKNYEKGNSYPLLHDIVSVVGHFFHDAEGSYMEKANEFLSVHVTDNNHNRGVSDLVCLCNLLILLEGSSDNLENIKASKTSFISTVLYIQTFVGQYIECTHFSLYFIQINEEIQITC